MLRKIITSFAIISNLLLADAITKQIAVAQLKEAAAISVIPGFFNLAYVENRGCAWGLFQNQVWPLAIFGIFAIIIILWQRKNLFFSSTTGDTTNLCGRTTIGDKTITGDTTNLCGKTNACGRTTIGDTTTTGDTTNLCGKKICTCEKTIPRGNKICGCLAEWFLLSGIIGNLLDRIVRGYVVDFLDFYIGKNHFPCFNLADAYISLAVILLLYLSFKK